MSSMVTPAVMVPWAVVFYKIYGSDWSGVYPFLFGWAVRHVKYFWYVGLEP